MYHKTGQGGLHLSIVASADTIVDADYTTTGADALTDSAVSSLKRTKDQTMNQTCPY